MDPLKFLRMNQDSDAKRRVLKNGFKAIDTANQRKHYDEIAVGRALKLYLEKMEVSREDLFVQTKFTHIRRF